MWYAVVINTDAEKAFRYLLYTRAGRKILPARPKTTCSRNLKGKKIYPFFAVRVTSTASGGQKRRTGANREVPSPAETCTGTSP